MKNAKAYKEYPAEYSAWSDMRIRCSNPKHKQFNDYGGRGVKVCDRWSDFYAFLEDMGCRPDGMSLERVDNDGDYEPGNCKWATRLEQNRNQTKTLRLEHNGVTMCAREWARELGINANTLYGRLRRGWPVSKALVK